ncbi:MAG: hypothetical protein A3F46_07030 [Legionellales bacterium RIFCSPHIGHO2_12_FULL_42_9]|nr:MAG: hypothetical protein A3F46_07030 [Legionellales bacterium RIFCSPHIGHO2_12_FULL_42_9]
MINRAYLQFNSTTVADKLGQLSDYKVLHLKLFPVETYTPVAALAAVIILAYNREIQLYNNLSFYESKQTI